MYAPTIKPIRDHPAYFSYFFSQITGHALRDLADIESRFKIPPRATREILQALYGDLLVSVYTAEDAVRDGVFMKYGTLAFTPVYITSNLYNDGYDDEEKEEKLIQSGLEMLFHEDPEDSDTMRLRVVKKNEIWVAETGDGITFMKPEDY